MKIIILGAGAVGGTLASHLAREHNKVTVVDVDEARLIHLRERLDIQTVTGHGAYPDILRHAGAADADMLIAVTDSDETNILACQLAYILFRTPTKIARVRTAAYLAEQERLFTHDTLPIDVVISPENLITAHILSLFKYPDALQMVDFAHGEVFIGVVKLKPQSPLIGQKQSVFFQERHVQEGAQLLAIYRGEHYASLGPTHFFEEGDHVFFMARKGYVDAVLKRFGRMAKPVKRVVIAGGGNIGSKLAQHLEQEYSVKVIEKDPARTHMLGLLLNEAVVLQGDASDNDLLVDENIQDTDIFCAITHHDETNILSSFLAKKLGAKHTMAIVTRPAYVDVVESNIDIAISPELITTSAILAHVRRGDVVHVHSLRHGDAEVMEAIAHGNAETSHVVSRNIEDLPLPSGVKIAAIVREGQVILPQSQTRIHAEDHVILFLARKQDIREVERLFQVHLHFI